MSSSRIAWIITALFAVVIGAGVPHLAFASTGLTIQPVKISETLKPGETVQGVIHLTNASDGAVDVTTSVQDFIPTAGADTISFVGRAPGVTSVRDWITLGGGSSEFTFAVNQSRDIPYTITAPADAEPGGHFGVVFFKATDASSSASQLKVGTQVGMLVLVAIPGNHLEKGNIVSFTTPPFEQTGSIPFDLTFQNTGTLYFEPKGQIVITNMFGGKVASVPIQGQIVLPTSIKDLKFNWDVKGLLIGRYTATATVLDSTGDVLAVKQVSFWAIPIWYTLGFIVVFIVLFFVFRFLKKRVRISFSSAP